MNDEQLVREAKARSMHARQREARALVHEPEATRKAKEPSSSCPRLSDRREPARITAPRRTSTARRSRSRPNTRASSSLTGLAVAEPLYGSRGSAVEVRGLEREDLDRDIAGGVDAADERHRAAAERLLDDRTELILERVVEEQPSLAQPLVLAHRHQVALRHGQAGLEDHHERVRSRKLRPSLRGTAAERLLVGRTIAFEISSIGLDRSPSWPSPHSLDSATLSEIWSDFVFRSRFGSCLRIRAWRVVSKCRQHFRTNKRAC